MSPIREEDAEIIREFVCESECVCVCERVSDSAKVNVCDDKMKNKQTNVRTNEEATGSTYETASVETNVDFATTSYASATNLDADADSDADAPQIDEDLEDGELRAKDPATPAGMLHRTPTPTPSKDSTTTTPTTTSGGGGPVGGICTTNELKRFLATCLDTSFSRAMFGEFILGFVSCGAGMTSGSDLQRFVMRTIYFMFGDVPRPVLRHCAAWFYATLYWGGGRQLK